MKNVDEYLAAVPEPARSTLQKVRAAIRSALPPEATEVISYQMPAFRYEGRLVVSFAAWKSHCSLYPMSYAVIDAHRGELTEYSIQKGTIRFTHDRPLPAGLVKKLVKARIAENATGAKR